MDSEIFGKFENSVRHGETLKNLMISAYFSMSYSTSRDIQSAHLQEK